MRSDHQISFILLAALGFLCITSVFGQIDLRPERPKPLISVHDNQNEWNKLAVDSIIGEMAKDPKGTGYILVKDDKGLRNRLRMLRTASMFRKIDESRLTYLIGEADGFDTESFFLKAGDETHICEKCVVIRAADFSKLDKLFRLRGIAR